MQKSLKKKVLQLPIVGVIAIFSSIYIYWLISNGIGYWALSSIPLKFIGCVTAIIVVLFISPGGNINYYFLAHKKTKDELDLNKLISKYSSKLIVLICVIILILIDCYRGLSNYSSEEDFNRTNIDGYIFFILLTFFIITAYAEGIKYITAWWNFKRKNK